MIAGSSLAGYCPLFIPPLLAESQFQRALLARDNVERTSNRFKDAILEIRRRSNFVGAQGRSRPAPGQVLPKQEAEMKVRQAKVHKYRCRAINGTLQDHYWTDLYPGLESRISSSSWNDHLLAVQLICISALLLFSSSRRKRNEKQLSMIN